MASLTDLGWGYLALLVLFAAIFIAVLVMLIRNPPAARTVPAPEPAVAGTLADAMAVPGAVPDPYLLRYVIDDAGARIGESLAMTKERLIVKREGDFHAIPLGNVTIEGADLVARAVDWESAKRDGEAWRVEQAAKHDPLDMSGADSP